MKKILIATAVLLAVSPAFARSVTMQTELQNIKIHGKMTEVHVMTMDDGTTIYGLTKSDFDRFRNQALPRR